MIERQLKIIGIDPDCDKNGVAFLDVDSRALTTFSIRFPQLLELLKEEKEASISNAHSLLVVVEAGWLNQKSNFHTSYGRSGECIAKKVGANHETGRKIIEMCQFYGIDVIIKKPLRKCWKGPGRKITQQELASITGYRKRTNQEERDAALIAWVHAGLNIPII